MQHAITNSLTIDIAYVGTHAGNQDNFIDIDQPPIGAGWDPAAVATCLASARLYGTPGTPTCLANPAKEVGSGAVCTACPYGTKYPFLTNISQLVNKRLLQLQCLADDGR